MQRRRVQLIVLMVLGVLGTVCRIGTAQPAVPNEEYSTLFAALHKTPNWRFITPEFIERINAKQKRLSGTPVTVLATLKDPSGDPVVGAFALLRLKSASTLVKQNSDVFAVAWSDVKGIVRFNRVSTPWFEPTYQVGWELCVFAPGMALSTEDFIYLQGNHILQMQLEPGIEAKGQVIDAQGKPLAGFQMQQYEVMNPYSGAMEHSFLHSEIEALVTSDENGRVRFGGLPKDRVVSIGNLAIAPRLPVAKVATSPLDAERLYPKDRPRSDMIYPFQLREFNLQVEEDIRPRRKRAQRRTEKKSIIVRVLDFETGKGIPGVGIAFTTNKRAASANLWPGMDSTNQDGEVQLEVDTASNQGFVYARGRCWGYLVPFDRMFTSTADFMPQLPLEEWFKPVELDADEPVEVEFRYKPVSPLEIKVLNTDGEPCQGAEVTIEWTGTGYSMPPQYTDKEGLLKIAVRPVLFDIDVTASTDDGLYGELTNLHLPKDHSPTKLLELIVR